MLSCRLIRVAVALVGSACLSLVCATDASAQLFADDAREVAPAPAPAAEPAAKPLPSTLSPSRWSEPSFGVSLNPPRDARQLPETRGQALAHFQSPTFTISVFIRETDFALEMPDIARRAVEQMALPYPSAVLLSNVAIQPAGRPGARLYFKIPDPKRATWIMGQSLMQIDPHTVVLLRLEVDEVHFEQVRPIYEAVVDTLSVASPEELDARREKQIARGKAWREALTSDIIDRALGEEQWLRLVKNRKDLGYMRIRANRGKEWDTAGVRVDIDVHIVSERETVDTESRYFLTDAGDREIWSVKTAVRPRRRAVVGRPGAAQPATAEALWVETGLRADSEAVIGGERKWANIISVDRKDPAGADQQEWELPPEGYLSQVEAQLLGSLLPGREPAEYGFYAYSSVTRDISYRTDRVEPLPNGEYKVYTRLSPTQPEQVSHYDARGRLILRILPDNTEIRASTAREMKAIWKIR